MNTEEYLKANELSVLTAIQFTLNDIDFMDKYGYEEIVINKGKCTRDGKSLKETKTRIELLERLYYLVRKEKRNG